jgi:hypothetical protein
MRAYLVAAVAALSLSIAATSAEAQSRVRAGGLACDMAQSVGFIIGSRQQVSCRFTPNGGGPIEVYNGHISRVGLDIGITAGGRMIWGVFARTKALPPRMLAGTYVGASGDVSVGVGGGANVLVGGSNRTISLQPLSLQGQAGVNLALGVARLTLY